jgi:hypothetical protein
MRLTDADRENLKQSACMHCGGVHSRKCPRISEMTFKSDGRTLENIKFHMPGWEKKVHRDAILWPEDWTLTRTERVADWLRAHRPRRLPLAPTLGGLVAIFGVTIMLAWHG